MANDKGNKSLNPKDFEDALDNLENIVKELEDGDLSLEKRLKQFEIGVHLERYCRSKLEEAERRLEVLKLDNNGKPELDADGEIQTTPLERTE